MDKKIEKKKEKKVSTKIKEPKLVARKSLSLAEAKDFLYSNREIYLTGDISGDDADICQHLYHLDYIDDKEPITIYINSYGGVSTTALAIADVISHIKSPVHTISMGICCSSAVLIAGAGQVGNRYAFESCTFTVHELTVDCEGRYSKEELAERMQLLTFQDEKYWNILKRQGAEKLNNYYKNECFRKTYHFDAPRAIELGLIDKIIKNK